MRRFIEMLVALGVIWALYAPPALPAPVGQQVTGAAQVRSTNNASGTITTGNTFQQIVAANNSLQSVTIQNNNTNTDNCWVFVGATASATKGHSIILQPGGSWQRYWPYTPAEAINITCTTTSDTFYADWQ